MESQLDVFLKCFSERELSVTKRTSLRKVWKACDQAIMSFESTCSRRIWNHCQRKKIFTMILLKELFIIAISMFKATMTVQITWAITKRWPKVEVREKAGSLTVILSSSTRPSNSQNISRKVFVCLKTNETNTRFEKERLGWWLGTITSVTFNVTESSIFCKGSVDAGHRLLLVTAEYLSEHD